MPVLQKALDEIRAIRDRAHSLIRESDNLAVLTTANTVEVTADAADLALQRLLHLVGEIEAPNCIEESENVF